jgi:hypothetical protein
LPGEALPCVADRSLEVCATAVASGVAIASFALQTSPASIIAARNAAACLGQLRLLLTAHTFVVGDANNAEAPSIAHPHCIVDEWVEFEALTTAGPAIVRRVNSQHASR